jgi:dolichol-phosphate mannosyltransferase
MRVSVVVPFYNEVDGIPPLAEKLAKLGADLPTRYELECVLVDDGSQDGGELQARKCFAGFPLVVFAKHSQNRGLGAAMRTGFAHTSGEIIVAIDSDCTYDPQQIPRLLEALESSSADIATASPYHPQGGVENVIGWRLFLSRGASWMYRCVCANKLYTYTSMMRAYRRAVIDNVGFESNGFAGVTEILLRASHQGYRIVEVPMMLRSRVTGVSKMKVARSMQMHLQLMTRALAWRLSYTIPATIANPREIS